MELYNRITPVQVIKNRGTLIMEKQNEKDTVINYTINPLQLLHEIQPLLKECFTGNFEVENNALNMRFENGQTFKLKIGEVV